MLPAAPAVTAPALAAAECIELVSNGDFEAFGPGWNLLASSTPPMYVSDVTFNNSGQAMRLGIISDANASSISAIEQPIALPATATSIVLTFRYYPLYDAEPGPGDLQYADIYNAMTNQFAGRALGVQLDERAWLAKDYDLTSLAGQSIRLVFAVNNDGVGGRTAMYIDNVSVTACALDITLTPAPAAAPQGTPDLSPTPALLLSATATLEAVTPAAGAVLSPAPSATPSDQEPAAEERPWLRQLGAIAVLVSILGAIGFVTFVILGTINSS
jgi:hypothetical protein